jgi:hypothetical protein
VLATGVLLAQFRLEAPVGDGVHLLYAAVATALIGGLGLQARLEDGAPAAYQSVLLVTGLVLLAIVLFRLADVLGAGDQGYPAGALVWGSLVFAGVALFVALDRRSAICGFLAAAAVVVAVLNAVQWLFEPSSLTPFRGLLIALALLFVLISLALRGVRYRGSVLLVDLAGLLILAMGLSFVGLGLLFVFAGDASADAGTGWELTLLVAACGLIAFGAVDRQPGPAFLGVANLAVFVLLAIETADGADTLLYWPILLLLLGAGVMAVGLRPNPPLPPEPVPYAAGERPLASRADDDDGAVIAVHIDD